MNRSMSRAGRLLEETYRQEVMEQPREFYLCSLAHIMGLYPELFVGHPIVGDLRSASGFIDRLEQAIDRAGLSGYTERIGITVCERPPRDPDLYQIWLYCGTHRSLMDFVEISTQITQDTDREHSYTIAMATCQGTFDDFGMSNVSIRIIDHRTNTHRTQHHGASSRYDYRYKFVQRPR